MNRKYALCVGINDYPGSGADLAGCVNDARDWAEILASAGYQVITLLDHGATRASVVGDLQHMVATAGWADRIVFTFSGHGTWFPDADGDEADGRDEALCCHDYTAGGFVRDDDLQAIFADLRYGSAALVLSDSCHSGTMSRDLAAAAADSTGRPRFLSPVNFVDGLDVERAVEMESRLPRNAPRRIASLISGCADDEYSYDAAFDGRPNGAFSRAALDTYSPGILLGGWHAAIRTLLPTSWYPQTPQLTAASAYRRYTRAL